MREWLSHYKWQGVDSVLLLDNNSTDGWREQFKGFESFAEVVPVAKDNAQTEHYNTVGKPWLAKNNIDIVCVVDLDEFVFGTDGKSLKQHVETLFQDDGLSTVCMTMRPFGSSGHEKQPPSIRTGFTWRKSDLSGLATKCVSRVRDLVEIRIHEHLVKGKSLRDPPGLQLNHYVIQSKEFFQKVKMSRGDGQHVENNRGRDMKYFAKHDFYDVEDTVLKNQVLALPQQGGRRRKTRRARRDRRTRRKQRGGNPSKLLRQVWCIWVGDQPMNETRKKCLESIKTVCGLPIVLVTNDTLKEYIKPGYPFHEAYQYLSGTHKCDYIRTYLMHHYGGAYADIKRQKASLAPAFDKMEKDPSIWITGYQELSENDVATTDLSPERAAELRANYKKLVGNCLYIVRPYTPFTTEWITRQAKKLDGYLDELKKHPAKHPRDGHSGPTQYPVPWAAILGSIMHDICLKYTSHVRQMLTPPEFTDYM